VKQKRSAAECRNQIRRNALVWHGGRQCHSKIGSAGKETYE
jgi:hypothetical protein